MPLALLIVIVNPLVYREGETLLIRGGEVLGYRIEITLEALVYGGAAALRLFVLALALALFSAMRRSRRPAAARAARVVPQRADRVAGHAARAGARARRAADERRRALPAARRRRAPRSRARRSRVRSTARSTWRRRSSCAATRRRSGRRATRRRGRATTCASRPRRSRSRYGGRVRALVAGAGGFEPYPTLEVGGRARPIVAALVLLPLFALGAVRRARARGWGWRMPEPVLRAEGFGYRYPERARRTRSPT